MKVLVTGTAGFIGNATAIRLLNDGHEVVGIDNLNHYYDVGLKKARLRRITASSSFRAKRVNLEDRDAIDGVFREFRPDRVIHLAAQPGVRYSIENPHAYVDSNIVGFMNILEGCRHYNIRHLVFASSSSVYGANTALPFSVHHNVDHPLSLYAATKKATELMAHTYSHLYKLSTTGLRFFTVYGPWGRPDMAPFIFARKIIMGEPIEVFNYGNHRRDFTYIADAVEGIMRALHQVATPNPDWLSYAPDPASSPAPYRIYNIGSHKPIKLTEYIKLLENKLGRTTEKRLIEPQPGDMTDTFADIADSKLDLGYSPRTPLNDGIATFIEWYLDYYRLNDI